MNISKHKSLLSNRYLFIVIFFCFFVCEASFAQNGDTSLSVSNNSEIYSKGIVHVGVGTQKSIFTGVKWSMLSIFFGTDVGYDVFSSEKKFNLSVSFGWIPRNTQVDNGPFSSVIFTMFDPFKTDGVKKSFLTGNVGWMWNSSKATNFSLNLGAGMKTTSTPINSYESSTDNSFFVNAEATIGLTFIDR